MRREYGRMALSPTSQGGVLWLSNTSRGGDGKGISHWPDTLECLDVQGVQGVDREMVETLKGITGADIIRRLTLEEEIFGGSDLELESESDSE
ncbi:hypothetical protein M407DRAFT_30377 [Tulasnella calospora MUT 4182]|uniref:Uncharacterized protein n=1 Tax=Tulasnella calospora MUT 4182 TaxID=1051891 RepID=A0A0C3LEV6_9AGAM|nr:hypothetical protein M407DRAFT_30377 [Tulasnella calospora MUT 4182]